MVKVSDRGIEGGDLTSLLAFDDSGAPQQLLVLAVTYLVAKWPVLSIRYVRG
jgi:hypothetical protein